MLQKTIISGLFFVGVISCRVDPEIKPLLPADNLVQIVPPGWPQPIYKFENNPITEERFVLGRALFYENMLSRDNTVSCGSCHQAFSAFAHSDHPVSHGVLDRNGKDQEGTRNSPGLFNLAWHPYFMHDGGVNHIEVQPLAPIANPLEMDEDINRVIDKLQNSAKYRELFKKAYGTEEVSSERMLKSMAQFMGLMHSMDTKYDYFKRGEKEFSEQELRGYNLFLQNCNSCHVEPLFSDFKYRNNGLAVDPSLNDGGRGQLKPDEPQHLYTFKTPSLRNVALTFPYMHDGRYQTLEDCLDHYTNGIVNRTNLDPLLENGISMTASEKADIISFLHTLNDFALISDPRFKDPNAR